MTTGDIGEIVPRKEALDAAIDWPVRASAESGAGYIVVSRDAVETMARPANVANVRGTYGFIVAGDAMRPELRPGDIAIINPHSPPLQGGTFVFFRQAEGNGLAIIGELRRQTQDKWTIRQHNPERDIALPRKDWQWVHRVEGHYRRR